MNSFAIKALAAASLSLLAVAPAAAQELQATVSYGDLDISSAAGAEALNARLLGTVKSVCERPDIRDLKAVTAWEACKDAAMSDALEQLSGKGAATVALTVHNADGQSIPYWHVESDAGKDGIAVRGGCFCNPGCAESAFDFPAARVGACLESLGDGFTIPRFAACLDDRTVGAIRVSMGLGTIREDVDRFLDFLRRYTEVRAAA